MARKSIAIATFFALLAALCLPVTAFSEGADFELSDPSVETADKTNLALEISQAQGALAETLVSADGSNVSDTEYWATAAERDALLAVLTAAQAVCADTSATQEQVTDVQVALQDACAAFMDARRPGFRGPEVNKSALESAIAWTVDALNHTKVSVDGSDVSDTEYWTTQEERDALRVILDASQDAYASPIVTQEEVADVVLILRDALAKFHEDRKLGTKGSEPDATQTPSPEPMPSAEPSPGPSASHSSEPVPSVSEAPAPSASPTSAPPAAGALEPRPDASVSDGKTPIEIVRNPAYAEGDPASLASLIVGIPITPANASSALSLGTAVADIGNFVQLTPDTAGVIRVAAPGGAQEVPSRDAPIATGMIVEAVAEDGTVAGAATVVVRGDLLGTGVMNISQLVRCARAISGDDALAGVFLQAAKVSGGEGNVNISDLVVMARMLAENVA